MKHLGAVLRLATNPIVVELGAVILHCVAQRNAAAGLTSRFPNHPPLKCPMHCNALGMWGCDNLAAQARHSRLQCRPLVRLRFSQWCHGRSPKKIPRKAYIRYYGRGRLSSGCVCRCTPSLHAVAPHNVSRTAVWVCLFRLDALQEPSTLSVWSAGHPHRG